MTGKIRHPVNTGHLHAHPAAKTVSPSGKLAAGAKKGSIEAAYASLPAPRSGQRTLDLAWHEPVVAKSSRVAEKSSHVAATPSRVAATPSRVAGTPSWAAPAGRPNTGLVSTGQRDYDYAPATMYDAKSKQYKMWFGGPNHGKGGDAIYMATRSKPSDPWKVDPKPVLAAGDSAFDALHVNDPTVVAAPDGTMYMYFSGGSKTSDDPSKGTWNSIGVASSSNGGKTWSTPKKVVGPANPADTSYGAGQPSVVYDSRSRYYYMMYTDTTSNPRTHGGGLVAMRSKSPTFAANDPSTKKMGAISTAAWGGGANADWALDAQTKSFVVASTGGEKNGNVFLHHIKLKADGSGFEPAGQADIDTGKAFADGGPALMRTGQGHLVRNQNGQVQLSGAVMDPSKRNSQADNIVGRPGPNPYQFSIATVET